MLGYIGGKSRIGKWIKDYIPTDIKTYVEPFGGMFWVYFNMDMSLYPNLNNIVYNDVNELNYNLFKCVSENPSRLHTCMTQYPNHEKGNPNTNPECRVLFSKFQEEIYQTDKWESPDYEIASKYVYVMAQIFSGANPQKATFMDMKGKYTPRMIGYTKKMVTPKWVDKFDKINEVENLDYSDLINKYDSPDTLFYLDPPYFSKEHYYSNHSFNKDSHEQLCNQVKNIKGKFIMSYYDFEDLEKWLPKDKYRWEYKDFAKISSISKGKESSKGTEVLIMNY